MIASHRQSPRPSARASLALRMEMRLGAGRSGVVFRSADEKGRPLARKVFDSDALTKAVQYLFLGAPNPYAWNEHAVQAALLRRRILAPLVELWFGQELRVARGYGQDWNEEYSAYQLHAEYIEGEPPRLHHPLARIKHDEVRHFRSGILQDLQAHLIETGFDGMLWQAGLGNPVALGNFLCERSVNGSLRWAWIDLESGVPALFPLRLRELFRFYLPRSFAIGRPLFDDVDIKKLKCWMIGPGASLVARLDVSIAHQMQSDIEALAYHQEQWKALPRHERSIQYQWKKGSISKDQAAWYKQRPWRWYALETRRLLYKACAAGVHRLGQALLRLRRIPWRKRALLVGRFLSSQRYRRELAQHCVALRINSWRERGQLQPAEASELNSWLARDEACSWLTDFGVHIAIKPLDKLCEFFLLPALYAAGLIQETTLGVGLILCGSVARTLYTLGRCIQATAQGRERPWIALGFGTLPVLGNLAYPVQILYSGAGRDDLLAQFLLYDGCSLIGAKLPIWGGRDTLTEHLWNRLPDRLLSRAGSRR